jgi:hypothetical protein
MAFGNPGFTYRKAGGQSGHVLTDAEYALFLSLIGGLGTGANQVVVNGTGVCIGTDPVVITGAISLLDPDQVTVNGTGVFIGTNPVVVTKQYNVVIGLDRIVVGPQFMVMTNG